MATELSLQLQENLLALLLFDSTRCRLVRAVVDARLWDRGYAQVAARAYAYIDRYGKAPGEHAADLFDRLLAGKDRDESAHYADLLRALRKLHRGINADYVVTRLQEFVRRQALKDALVATVPLVQGGADANMDEIEARLLKALKTRAQVFEPGVRLGDVDAVLARARERPECFMTGVPDLDRLHLGPERKCLHLMVGATGAGKSWWLISVGRHAATQRAKVCHITLEMSERQVVRRYMQAFFAVADDDAVIEAARLRPDPEQPHRAKTVHPRGIRPRLTFADENIDAKLARRIRRAQPVLNRIVVKEFPTGRLTLPQLSAYLDLLESEQRFVPDVLVLDYMHLMKLNVDNFRLDLGELVVALRGMAVERNMAVVSAWRMTRVGAAKGAATELHMAEDISAAFTADVVVVLNRTPDEAALGLSRVFVAKGRTQRDKFSMVITQSYGTGQFCLQSAYMPRDYAEQVARRGRPAGNDVTNDGED